MGDYRIYKLDKSGKTAGPPYIAQCEGDDAALVLGRLLADEQLREIWEGARRVATISAPEVCPRELGPDEATEIVGSRKSRT